MGLLEQPRDGAGSARLGAMRIGLIMHHLAIADALLAVDLPEDHVVVQRGESIHLRGMRHLFAAEDTIIDQSSGELVGDAGETFPYGGFEVSGRWPECGSIHTFRLNHWY